MSGSLIKAEGAGNDFILGTGSWAERLAADAGLVRRLCRRRFGIGADGVLAIFRESATVIRTVHRNADGSPSAFCANGTRCAARVAVERLGCDAALTIRTGWTEIAAEVVSDQVALVLPPPTPPVERVLAVDRGSVTGWQTSVGVPHLVIPVSGLATIDLDQVAGPLRGHPDLGPEGANVHLVESAPDGRLGIRSLERGVEAEVLCCGSGVVAAALVTLAETGGTTITVLPRSGDELVVTALADPPVTSSRLVGPARLVADLLPAD